MTLATNPNGLQLNSADVAGFFTLQNLRDAFASKMPDASPQPHYCDDVNNENSCIPGPGVMSNIANNMIVALTYQDGTVAAGFMQQTPNIPAPPVSDDQFYGMLTMNAYIQWIIFW